MRWLLRGVLALEAVRLLAWIVFLSYIALGDPADAGRANETMIFIVFGAFYLGFPYTWIGALLADSWSVLPTLAHGPLGVAVGNFLLWLLGSACLVFALSRWTRIRQTASLRSKPSPSTQRST